MDGSLLSLLCGLVWTGGWLFWIKTEFVGLQKTGLLGGHAGALMRHWALQTPSNCGRIEEQLVAVVKASGVQPALACAAAGQNAEGIPRHWEVRLVVIPHNLHRRAQCRAMQMKA